MTTIHTPGTVGTVGIIGLGLVGSALAQRLQGAGFACVGHDIRPESCERFAATGGTVATSPADAARRATVLITAVFDTRDVIAVIEGPNGALEGGTPTPSLTVPPATRICSPRSRNASRCAASA